MNPRYPRRAATRPKASTLIALVLIAVTAAFLIVDGNATNFLVCRVDCGETEIAEGAVERFKAEGFRYGLIQNHGTTENPYLYTHNVHIGSLFHVGLYALGLEDFRTRQLFTLFGFLVGLFYIFLACTSYGGSEKLGLVVLSLFCVSYWGVLGFAFNALRAWHFTALFAMLFHARGLFSSLNGSRTAHLIGVVFASTIAFGCGYDFWVICGSVAVAAVMLHGAMEGAWKELPRRIALLAFIFAIPFGLRQAQIIAVLGPAFWWQDIIYTLAIKVPGATTFVDIPPIEVIDEFYRTNGILRPPATPANSVTAILRTARDMLGAISVPRWGASSWMVFLGSLLAGAWLAIRSVATGARLTSPSTLILASLLVPLSVGAVVGLSVFAPFSLHVYLKHEFPLIAAPLLVAKGVVIYALGAALMKRNSPRERRLAAVVLPALLLDMGAIHAATSRNGLQPNFGWVEVLRDLPAGTNVAMSAYWSPRFKALLGHSHLEIHWVEPMDVRDMLADRREGTLDSSQPRTVPMLKSVEAGMSIGSDARSSPRSRYLVYQPLARSPNHNFDTASPDCAWQDPIWSGIQRTFTRKNVAMFRPLMISPPTAAPGSVVSIIGEVSGDGDRISKVELIASNPITEHAIEASPVYNCIYRTVKAWVRIPDDYSASFADFDVQLQYEDGRQIRTNGFRLEVSSDALLVSEPVVALAAAQPSVRELLREFPFVPVLRADDRRSGYVIFELTR